MKIPKGKFVYEKTDGINIVRFLSENGVKAEVIGTLPSNHDIDILVDKSTIPSKTPLHWLFEVALCARKLIKTDLGSTFVLSYPYGHVDVFFEDPRFKSSISCVENSRSEK